MLRVLPLTGSDLRHHRPADDSGPAGRRDGYDPAMSLLGFRHAALGGLLPALVVGLPSPAHADSFQQCVDQSADHGGVPPTCTLVDGKWVASWPDDGVGGGVPGFFVLLMVLAVVITVGVTIWKVSTARRLATESGLDPALATRMTLLTEDGLDATYLAASLRPPTATPAGPAPSPMPPAAERLTELKGLLDAGLVTQAEYDERRRAILDSV